MFPNIQRYLDMKNKSKNLPDVEVTEEEFVAALVATGASEKEAKFQATVSKGLGASTMVGDKMMKIKASSNLAGSDEPRPEQDSRLSGKSD